MTPAAAAGSHDHGSPPRDGEPTAAVAGSTREDAQAAARELAAALAGPEVAAGLVTLELLGRMILGTREPILIGITANEPLGVLERAALEPADDEAAGCL